MPLQLRSSLPLYVLLATGSLRSDASVTGSTALLDAGNVGGSPAGSGGAQGARRLIQAIYCPSGLSPKLRIMGRVITNAVAPTSTFTFDLRPVTPAGGGAAAVTTTTGAAVSGSAVSVVAPGLTTITAFDTGDFAAPADGDYGILFTVTGNMAASSAVQSRVDLLGRGV